MHPIITQLRDAGPTLSVGLVSADLMALGADVARLEQAGALVAHFDVMDGCYVPMLTVGPPFIKAVRTRMLKDVHLMIREPGTSVADYVAAGADSITVHPDACRHPHRVLQQIGSMRHVHDASRSIARGVALNPGMPVAALEPLLDEIDLVMLVAINPGFGGQTFLPATLARIEASAHRAAIFFSRSMAGSRRPMSANWQAAAWIW
jgi:ribulose-phosphate 3-epimerase